MKLPRHRVCLNEVAPVNAAVRVEWQLYELDTGELHRCPPKAGSRRTIDTPEFLSTMLQGHIASTQPKTCSCHGRTYVFRGLNAANGAVSQPGAKMVDVARRAEVSTGTVSTALNHPEKVNALTRAKIEAAITDLGYVRAGSSGQVAPHWRRNSFATWLFHPAATGWYPTKAPQDAHPVPSSLTPGPGFLREVAAPQPVPTPVGCRSPEALHPMG